MHERKYITKTFRCFSRQTVELVRVELESERYRRVRAEKSRQAVVLEWVELESKCNDRLRKGLSGQAVYLVWLESECNL